VNRVDISITNMGLDPNENAILEFQARRPEKEAFYRATTYLEPWFPYKVQSFNFEAFGLHEVADPEELGG
jgi:hypothetical protein